MEYVNCNLCGNTEFTVLYTLPDLLLGRKDVSATLVKCVSCGLIYQNPRFTLLEMGAHYPPEYESYDPEPEASNGSWLQRQSVQYGIAKRIRFITRHKKHGRLLDVGCAAGVFLRGIREEGKWQVSGVEISEHAAHLAQERYGLDVRLGTLEQAGFPAEFFDVVTMWDVLEHLHDPGASLHEIHRILKHDGIALIRVPNVNSWDAALLGRYWAGLDAPRHLYVFAPSTLKALLKKNGFEIKNWTSGIAAYPTFLLSLRFWSNARQKPNAVRDLLIQGLHHPVMRILTSPLFYLGGYGLHGPLMAVTAAKHT